MALLLAALMLWSQWLGFEHRIAHGVAGQHAVARASAAAQEPVAAPDAFGQSIAAADADQATPHRAWPAHAAGSAFCDLLDQLCLAAALPSGEPPLPLLDVVQVAPASTFWSSAVPAAFWPAAWPRAPPART